MSFFPTIDRALAWQQRAQKCLKNEDVANELKKLSSAANEVKESSKNKENTDGESAAEDDTEDTDMSDTENSATKLSAMKKLPDVKLSNKLMNLLEDLLLEGDLLETNMDECHQIWKLLQVKENYVVFFSNFEILIIKIARRIFNFDLVIHSFTKTEIECSF